MPHTINKKENNKKEKGNRSFNEKEFNNCKDKIEGGK